MTVISNWTDDRVEELKRLHAAGSTCGQIAIELGGVTRNAIIGKVHRLGLVSPKRPDGVRPVKAPKEPKTHKQRPRIVKSNGNSNSLRFIRAFETDQYKLRCVEIKCNTAWADVTGCWYPAGDGPFLFCNGKRADGSSYCTPHKALCDGQGTSSERAATRGIAA